MKISLILVVIGFIFMLLVLSFLVTACILSGGIDEESKNK